MDQLALEELGDGARGGGSVHPQPRRDFPQRWLVALVDVHQRPELLRGQPEGPNPVGDHELEPATRGADEEPDRFFHGR